MWHLPPGLPRATTAAAREDRRAQILTCAREEFAKSGYHATKIDDIVAAAKIARGTFYLYFSDKRAIFEELVDRFFARLGMSIQRVDTDDPTRTVEEQIRENMRRVLGVFLEDRTMTKIFVADAIGVDPAFDAKLMSFYDEVGKLFIESLSDGQKLGIVKRGDVRLYAYFTMVGIKEVLFHLVRRHWEYEVEELEEAFFAIIRGGYLEEKVAGKGKAPARKKRR